MIFYHGTSIENYKRIIREGFIHGERNAPTRVTYLTDNIREAAFYGKIIIQIDYDPRKEGKNNWCDNCWQHREYKPIKISKIEAIGFVKSVGFRNIKHNKQRGHVKINWFWTINNEKDN